MNKCNKCNIDINLPRAITCRKCVKKAISDRYCEKNREKLKETGKKFREENRKLAQERSRKSVAKKPEYYRLKRRENYRRKRGIPLNDPFVKRKAGEGNIDNNGYKTITKRGHPNQMDAKGRIREHVFVMSEHLGRPLYKGESVHHKNGDRLDNRIENLELWDRSQPAGQRVDEKIKWCIEFLTKHGCKTEK